MNAYLPFRGLSAWFSSSVRPVISKKWDKFGGVFSTEDDADFLFSDNSYSVDTVRVYDTQPGVAVFQTAWVNEVLAKRCTVHDVVLGQYLVLPHYLVQVCINGDPFKTPEAATLMEGRGETDVTSDATPQPAARGLAALLTRREDRKKRVKFEGGGERMKNSREYSMAQPGSGGGPSALKQVRLASESVPPSSEGTGGGGEGWERLTELAKTTNLSDVRHINNVEIMPYKLVGFNPGIPHFIMKRK